MCGEGLEEEGEKGGALDHGSLTFSMEGQLTVKSQGRVESEWTDIYYSPKCSRCYIFYITSFTGVPLPTCHRTCTTKTGEVPGNVAT